jgi:dTDP-6-deoxy-L-talose 4-dehydrogenase (NAD+)
MKKRILITGVSGFIGRHVLKQLKKEDVEIFALVRDTNKISDLRNDIDEIILMDIGNASKDIFSIAGKPDLMIHLAWDGLPNYQSSYHSEEELPRQYAFLKAMILGGLKSLVITGTCFEYGMQEGCLYENQKTKPDNSYGSAKDGLHHQLLHLNEEIPFDMAWCRLFYMWGKGQSEQSLYSQLKAAVSRGDELFNMSEGEQLRDYLPVEIVAEYLIRISKQNKSITTVNIASGNPISVRSLVENWLETNQWKIKLNTGFYPYSPFEPMEFWGDTSNLNMLLNHE